MRAEDLWLSWEEVESWAKDIGAPTVPVLFEGTVASEKQLQALVQSFMFSDSKCGGIIEGIVARNADSFYDNHFSNNVFKLVRANHVNTSIHWKEQIIIKNKLKAIDK